MFQIYFEIRFLPKAEAEITQYHFHNEIEFLIPITPGGQLWIENSIYNLQPGTLFMIDEYLLHHQSNSAVPYDRYVLHVSSEELEKCSSPATDFLSCVTRAPRAINIQPRFPQILDCLKALASPPTGEFGGEVSRSIHFLSFLLEVCRLLDKVTEVYEVSSDTAALRILKIQKYIQNNCTRRLSLDEIATEFYISKYHLCHLFKETTHYSVVEFVNYCRITRACKLLRGRIPPSQVGEAVGFQSDIQFTRIFKRWIGVTPAAYYRKYASTSYIGRSASSKRPGV